VSTDSEIDELVDETNPSFEHVLSCVFGIEPHESRTYLELLERPGSTADELSTALDRDRSNVNRSLSTLLERGLAERNRRLLDGGGYVYQYAATPLPEAKSRLHDALDTWVSAVHDVIDEFDAD
jgi:predicted transcriptional regulator